VLWIDVSISKVSKEIEALHSKVQVEKIIRAYKEEYEAISRVINDLPSRQDLAAYAHLKFGLSVPLLITRHGACTIAGSSAWRRSG
jgi:hypothetical protein